MKQSDENFSTPKYEKISGGGGGPGGPLRRTQGYQIFRAVRPHNRVHKCITTSCSYMGPNVNKCACLAIRGGGGGGHK